MRLLGRKIRADMKAISGEGGPFLQMSSWRKDSIAWEKMLGEFLPDSTESFAEIRVSNRLEFC